MYHFHSTPLYSPFDVASLELCEYQLFMAKSTRTMTTWEYQRIMSHAVCDTGNGGDLILLCGSSTMTKITSTLRRDLGRKTPDFCEICGKWSWHLILFHPCVFIEFLRGRSRHLLQTRRWLTCRWTLAFQRFEIFEYYHISVSRQASNTALIYRNANIYIYIIFFFLTASRLFLSQHFVFSPTNVQLS